MPRPRVSTPQRVSRAVEIIPESSLVRNIAELLNMPPPTLHHASQTFHPPKNLRSGNATQSNLGPAATPARHVHARSEGNIAPPLSPIDALASVAAQSPVLPSPRRTSYQSQVSPTTTTWPPFQWDASRQPPTHPSYPEERPSKRARSELLPSPQQTSPHVPQSNARPATSYDGPYNLGCNVEQEIQNRQRVQSIGPALADQTQSTGSRRDDSNPISDAELLLDFSRRASNAYEPWKARSESKASLHSPTSPVPPLPYSSAAPANGTVPSFASDCTFGPPLSNATTRDSHTQRRPSAPTYLPASQNPALSPLQIETSQHVHRVGHAMVENNERPESAQYIQRVAHTMIENSGRIVRNMKAKYDADVLAQYADPQEIERSKPWVASIRFPPDERFVESVSRMFYFSDAWRNSSRS